jgi:hypothetical protein
MHDTKDAGLDCEPAGLVDIDPGEGDVMHPAEDPLINDDAPAAGDTGDVKP